MKMIEKGCEQGKEYEGYETMGSRGPLRVNEVERCEKVLAYKKANCKNKYTVMKTKICSEILQCSFLTTKTSQLSETASQESN